MVFALIAAALLLLVLALGTAFAVYLVYPKKPTYKETLIIEAFKDFLRGYPDVERTEYAVKSFDGYFINAEVLPAGETSKKYVILSHGYSYDRHGSVKYTHLFKALGYNCIIYDNRGHGLNEKFPCSFGIRESRDLIALIDDAYARFGEDIFLGIHGESMGSGLGVMSLKYQPRIRFVVSDCGYADFFEVVKEKMKGFHLPSLFAYPANLMSRIFFGVNLRAARPVDCAAANEIPLCLIHGDSDTLIPPSHAERIRKANKGYAEIHFFEGAEHAKSFETDEERYLQILKNFLSLCERNDDYE